MIKFQCVALGLPYDELPPFLVLVYLFFINPNVTTSKLTIYLFLFADIPKSLRKIHFQLQERAGVMFTVHVT